MDNLGKATNTVFSISAVIDNEDIAKVKVYMNENFGNRYSLKPHITFALVPMPEENLELAKQDIDKYFSKIDKPIFVKLGGLKLTKELKTFMVSVIGDKVKQLHEDLTNILNTHRGDYVREKDLKRAKTGFYSDTQLKYLKKYGYARVMELYESHITIGNCPTNNVDVDALEEVLKGKLINVLNKEITIKEFHVSFHTDAKKQSDMKILWEKNYPI